MGTSQFAGLDTFSVSQFSDNNQLSAFYPEIGSLGQNKSPFSGEKLLLAPSIVSREMSPPVERAESWSDGSEVLLTAGFGVPGATDQKISDSIRITPFETSNNLSDSDVSESFLEGVHGGRDRDLLLRRSFSEQTIPSQSRSLIIVDESVENYHQILSQADPKAQVLVLSSQRDGLEQISEALAQLSNLDAVHIFSHGDAGRVRLGSTELNSETIAQYEQQLHQWRTSLNHGADLLFYGCNLAAGEEGAAFVQQLGELTGADIAASEDLTGSAALGGDWVLEYWMGDVETQAIASPRYSGVLFDLDAAFTDDVRNALLAGVGQLTAIQTNLNDSSVDANGNPLNPVASALPGTDATLGNLLGLDTYFGLGDSIQAYIDATDPNATSLNGLTQHLESTWMTTLPITTGLTASGDADGFTLKYQANNSYQNQDGVDFALTKDAVSFGIELQTALDLTLDIDVDLDFELSFDWNNFTADFALNQLDFEATATADELVVEGYFGPLEMSIGSNDAGKAKGEISLALAGGISYANNEFDVTPDGSRNTLDVTLPFYGSLLGHDFSRVATPTATIAGEILGTAGPTFGFTGFEQLENFSNVGVGDVVVMLQDMVVWGQEYRQYEVMQSQLPFLDLNLGDALDFASAMNTEVLDKIDFYQAETFDVTLGQNASLSTTVDVDNRSIATLSVPADSFSEDFKNKSITLENGSTYEIEAVVNARTLTFVLAQNETLNLSGQSFAIHEELRAAQNSTITNGQLTLTTGNSIENFVGKFIVFENQDTYEISSVIDNENGTQTLSLNGAETLTLTNQSYVIKPQRQLLRTYQELIGAINNSGVLPDGVAIAYDPVENELVFPFAFDKSFVTPNTQLGFGLETGDLSLSSDSTVQLNSSVTGRLDLGIDFDGPNNINSDGLNLFIENLELNGSAGFSLNDLSVNAGLGFVGLTAGGTGSDSGISLAAAVATGLDRDPNTVTPGDRRFSFNELINGTLFDAFNVDLTGEASAKLKGLSVNSDFGNFNIAPNTELAVYVPDLSKLTAETQVVTQPLNQAFDLATEIANGAVQEEGAIVVLPQIDDLLKLREISFQDVVNGIDAGIKLIRDSLQGNAFYDSKLPIINQSLREQFDFLSDLSGQLANAVANPAGLLQEVESVIENALGLQDDNNLPADQQKFSLALNGQYLDIHLGWQALLSKDFSFGLDLDSLKVLSGNAGAAALDGISALADLNAGGGVTLEAIADLNFDIALDLNSIAGGNAPDLLLRDYDPNTGKGTHAELGARLKGENLDLAFKLGPIDLGVGGGLVILDGDGNAATDDYAGVLIAIDQQNGGADDGFFKVGTEALGNNLQTRINGGFDINLPLKLSVAGVGFDLDPITVKTNPTYGNQGVAQLFKHIANSADAGSSDPLVMTFPDIRGEFEDLGGQFSLLGLINDPSFVLDGVDLAVGTLEDVLDSNLAQDIPLVGDQLAEAASFLREMRYGLLSDLRAKLSGDGKAIEFIRDSLFDVLGPGNLNLLLDSNGDGINADDIEIGWFDAAGNLLQPWAVGGGLPENADAIQFDMQLGGDIFADGIEIPLDLDLPGFSLDVDGGFALDMGWSFDFGFGLSLQDTFYLATDKDGDDPELELEIKAFLDGTPDDPKNPTQFTGTGELLFFKASIEDNNPNNRASGVYGDLSLDLVGNNRGRLTLDQLLSGGIGQVFDVNFGVDANLDLGMTLELNGAEGLPRLGGDLEVNWNWDVGQPVSAPQVDMTDFRVDLGSFVTDFLSPVAQRVHDTLKPIEPLIDILNTKVPGLSVLSSDDTLKGLINLIMRLKGRSPIDWSFIDDAEQMLDLVGKIGQLNSSENQWLFLGDITGFGTPNLQSITNINPNSASSAQLESFFNSNTRQSSHTLKRGSTPRAGFQMLEHITDIGNWTSLLSGGDATLFSYELPLLEFQADFNLLLASIGILPRIAAFDVYAFGNFSATADLSFGYDTFGIRQAINTGNPLYALDGFFVNDFDSNGYDKDEFFLNAELGLKGRFSAGPIGAGLRGSVQAYFGVDMQDIGKPNLVKDDAGYVVSQTFTSDGKIRGSELAAMWKHPNDRTLENLFNLTGRVDFVASAFVDLDLWLKTVSLFDKELFRKNLINERYNAPQVEPILAEKVGSTLFLNSGDRAENRVYNTDDGGEHFFLYGSGSTVQVEFDGYYQEYTGITKVVADGGNGDDRFDASRLQDIRVEITGGVGDDVLIAGSGGSRLDGGVGEDQLTGGRGSDEMLGGDGDDRLNGGDGDDIYDGGNGADRFTDTAGDDTYVFGDGFGIDRMSDRQGQNTFDASGATQSLGVVLNRSGVEMQQENGLNVIKASGTEFKEIKLGSGNDDVTITNYASGNLTFTDRGGDDSYRLRMNANSAGVIRLDDTVGAADQLILEQTKPNTKKPDAVTLTDTQVLGFGLNPRFSYANLERLELQLTNADDELTITNQFNGDLEVIGGDGDDNLTLISDATQGTVNIKTELGDDQINVQRIATTTIVSGGDDNDTVNVRNTSSQVDQIAALLTVAGDAGEDVLNVDDSGDSNNNQGELTGDRITGLDMAGEIAYGTVETLNITLGSGSDEFTIKTTHQGQTNLQTADGEDQVVIETTAGETNVDTAHDNDSVIIQTTAAETAIATGNGSDTVLIQNTGAATTVSTEAGNDQVTVNQINADTTVNAGTDNDDIYIRNTANQLDDIRATLTLAGDEGRDRLFFDDSGDNNDNSGELSGNRLTGLDMAGEIVYGTMERVELQLGSGNDSLTVSNTHQGASLIEANDGNDQVQIQARTGELAVNGNAGQDRLDADGTVGSVNLSGGSDRDEILGGSGDDYLRGDADLSVDLNDNTIRFSTPANEAADKIWGREGKDLIFGEGGDDGLIGGSETTDRSDSEDYIFGGSGNDVIAGDNATVDLTTRQITLLDETAGNADYLLGDEGTIASENSPLVDSRLKTGDRVQPTGNLVEIASQIAQSAGDDKIAGGTGDDLILGSEGRDEVDGNSGDDRIFGDHAAIAFTKGEIATATSTFATAAQGAGPAINQSDRLSGNEGDDIIVAGAGDDVEVYGNAGNDIILGDSGQLTWSNGSVNRIESQDVAAAGADRLEGNDGNDILFGGSGDDELLGQLGEDVLLGDSGRVEQSSGLIHQIVSTETETGGRDRLSGNEGNDVVIAGAGDDTEVFGNDGDDVILGDNGQLDYQQGIIRQVSTTVPTSGGADRLTGNSGNDTILGGQGSDTITGDSGNDTILGDNGRVLRNAAGATTQVSTSNNGVGGNDNLAGNEGRDVIVGGGAHDTATGNGGDDILVGDDAQIDYSNGQVSRLESQAFAVGGNDVLNGNDGNDVAFGGSGNDQVSGDRGNDLLMGDNGSVNYAADGNLRTLDEATTPASRADIGGSDNLFGGLGQDVILGGANDDKVEGNQGNDVILGDNGQAFYSNGVIARVVSLNPELGGDDQLLGNENDDAILGGQGNDKIAGDANRDVLLGDNGQIDFQNGLVRDARTARPDLGGQDNIEGGSEDDVILAGAASDFVQGGSGKDAIAGDHGFATFAFTGDASAPADGNLTTLDFITTIDPGFGDSDILLGGLDDDTIFGGSGNDAVHGDGVSVGVQDSAVDLTGEAIALADFDGDGIADVLLRNPATGQLILQFVQGNQIRSAQVLQSPVIRDPHWQVVAAADFTGDGISDLIWHNKKTQQVVFWQVSGGRVTGATPLKQPQRLSLDWDLIGIANLSGNLSGNLNGSGSRDLVWRNRRDGRLTGLLMRGSQGTQFISVDANATPVLTATDAVARSQTLAPAPATRTFANPQQSWNASIASETRPSSSGDADLILGDQGKRYFNLAREQSYVAIDTSAPLGGNDQLYGGQGDDKILGQQGADYVNGGSGEDDIVGGHNVVGGSDGNDTLEGGDQADVILGDNGSISRRPVAPGSEVWQRHPAPFPDVIRDVLRFDDADGLNASDLIRGGNGDDILEGQRGDDRIEGGAGDDEITGGLGQDSLFGGDNNDSILGDNGAIIRTYNADGTPQIDPNGSWHRDVILTDTGRVVGAKDLAVGLSAQEIAEADLMILSGLYNPDGSRVLRPDGSWATIMQSIQLLRDGDDFVDGGNGDDKIFGQGGDDALNSGEGENYIEGNSGTDQLSGSSGNDFFIGDDRNSSVPWASGLPNATRGINLISQTADSNLQLGQFGSVITTAVNLNANPEQGFIPTLSIANQGESNTSLGTPVSGITNGFGQIVKPLVRIVPGVSNRGQFYAGPDTLRGGGGQDTLVGDNIVSTMPVRTGVAAIDSQIQNLTRELNQLVFDLHDIELGWQHLTRPGRQTLVIGKDNLDGGNDADFIVGDNLTLMGPLEVAQPNTSDNLVALLGDLRNLTAQFDQRVLAALNTLPATSAPGYLPNVLDQGNDTLTGGNGDDRIFGDDALFLAPVLDQATYQPGSFWDYGFSQLRRNRSRNLRDWDQYRGNDTLIGNAGNDWVLGDHGTVVTPIVTQYADANRTSRNLELLRTDVESFLRDLYEDDYGIAHNLRDQSHALSLGNDVLSGEAGEDFLIGDVATVMLPWFKTATGGQTTLTTQIRDGYLDVDSQAHNFFQGPAKQHDLDFRNLDLATAIANDTIYGGDGNDVAFGLRGNDQLFGQLGNDALFGGDDDDPVVDGGSGDDRERKSNPSPKDEDLLNAAVNAKLQALLSPVLQQHLVSLSQATPQAAGPGSFRVTIP